MHTTTILVFYYFYLNLNSFKNKFGKIKDHFLKDHNHYLWAVRVFVWKTYHQKFCTPLSVGGVEPPTKFSKKGVCLTGPQLWAEVAGKEGVTLFREGCNFYKKMNLNLKYFTTKKFINRNIFLCQKQKR